MINRYSRESLSVVWSDQHRFELMLQIEILVAEAQANLGLIPRGVSEILNKAHIDLNRIQEIEKETQHETVAFLTHISEQIGEDSRFLHYGMTSSDVLDTCFSLQLREATQILLSDLDVLIANLELRAKEHQETICIGRTHGVHAEPMTFAHKLLGHVAAFERNKKRLVQACEEISICKISGPVGNYSNLTPEVESYVAERLKLQPEMSATQVIPRDRHALFFSVLAIIATSVENLATEIRHLQRTEVREVQEAFRTGQKGSSAMPHKKNPILSENLTGLARLVRSYVLPSLENIVLWHERDMSHSSVERVIAPDATLALDFALHRLAQVIESLEIDAEQMKKNLNSLGGLHHSQAVLLALIQAGLSREEAYRVVQRNALEVWQKGGNFQDKLNQDPIIGLYLGEDRAQKLGI